MAALYETWTPLEQLDQDLGVRAAALKMPLPTYTSGEPLAPDDERGLRIRSWQQRAITVEQILRRDHEDKRAPPMSWQYLAARLTVDADPYDMPQEHWLKRAYPEEDRRLRSAIEDRSWYRASRDKDLRQKIILDVVYDLYLIIIRNAGPWSQRIDRGDSWWGFVKNQVRSLTRRAALVNGPDKAIIMPAEFFREIRDASAPAGPRELRVNLKAMETLSDLQVSILVRTADGHPLGDIAAALDMPVYRVATLRRQAGETIRKNSSYPEYSRE